jgi:hypothetical protein
VRFSQSIKTHRKEILVALALVWALVALICWRACQTTGPQAKWKEATKPKLVTSALIAPKGEIPSEPIDTKKPALGDYLPWPKEQEAQYLREFGLTTWTGLSLARKELMTSTDPYGVLQLTNNADVNKLEIQFQRVADAEGRPLEEVAVDMMFAVRESFISRYDGFPGFPVMRLVWKRGKSSTPYLWRRVETAAKDDLYLGDMLDLLLRTQGKELARSELTQRLANAQGEDARAKYQVLLFWLEEGK